MTDLEKLIKGHLQRQELLPGVTTGRFEQAGPIDKVEVRSQIGEESGRRDNRINIRTSGKDLTELQKLALADGIPTQSLIANIIHQYVQGELVDVSSPALAPAPVASQEHGYDADAASDKSED